MRHLRESNKSHHVEWQSGARSAVIWDTLRQAAELMAGPWVTYNKAEADKDGDKAVKSEKKKKKKTCIDQRRREMLDQWLLSHDICIAVLYIQTTDSLLTVHIFGA